MVASGRLILRGWCLPSPPLDTMSGWMMLRRVICGLAQLRGFGGVVEPIASHGTS